MPAPSVSLVLASSVNVSGAGRAPQRAESALPVAAPAQDFGQWMREMQSRSDTPSGGDSLPAHGEALPAQRQEGGAAAMADADRKEAKATPTKAAQTNAGADSKETVDTAQASARPVTPDSSAAEGFDDQSAQVGVSATDAHPSDPALDTALTAGSAAPAPDTTLSEASGPTDAATANSATTNHESGSKKGERPPLPANAARPEVRDLATQNGTGTEQNGSAEVNHGQQVSEVARQAGRPPADARAKVGTDHGTSPAVPARASNAGKAKVDERESAPVNASADVASKAAGLDGAVSQTDVPVSDTPDSVSADAGSAVPSEAAGQSLPVAAMNNAAVSDVEHHSAATATVFSGTDGVTVLRQAHDGAAGTAAAREAVNGAAGASNAMASGHFQQPGQQSDGQDAAQRQPDPQLSLMPAAQHKGSSDVASSTSHTTNVMGVTDVRAGGDGSAQLGLGTATDTGGLSTRSDAGSVNGALAQRLLNPAWGQAVGQRAIMMAQHGPRSAEIKLDPPELGALQIRIHIGHQDQVSVSFASPHAAVRDVLEQQMPRLREMFAEQGLNLGQSSVSDQSNQGSDERSSGSESGRQGGGGYVEGSVLPGAGHDMVPVGLVDYYA